jgi:hypothetical protein
LRHRSDGSDKETGLVGKGLDQDKKTILKRINLIEFEKYLPKSNLFYFCLEFFEVKNILVATKMTELHQKIVSICTYL